MNRLIGILALACMLTANVQLVLRDFWPEWTAGAPPVLDRRDLPENDRWRQQAGVYVKRQRVGTAWTEASRLGHDRLTVATSTRLDVIQTGGDVLLPDLLIETDFVYFDDGRLESLRAQILGFGQLIQVSGRYVPPSDFPCQWQAGDRRGSFVLPASATRSMGDQLQPFRRLGKLTVGMSWRVKVIDPLAGAFSGFTAGGLETRDLVVQVLDKVSIEHLGEMIDAYELRAGNNIRAWISEQGEPVRQEIRMPLLGLVEIISEPFDFVAREDARYRGFDQ